MAMPASRAEAERWTVDMLDALPDDGNRYEIIDGELLVTPAPSYLHQRVVLVLASRLEEYLRPTSAARVVTSPSDVRRPDRDKNKVQPDVFVVRLTDGRYPPYPFELTDLLLAIEVSSPSNRQDDYQTKRDLYLRSGVPEYWILDAEARTAARWRTAADPGELLTERVEWQPVGVDHALVIDLPQVFNDALG